MKAVQDGILKSVTLEHMFIMNLRKKFPQLKKWHLAFKIVPIVTVIVGLKLLLHTLSFEWISLNALFTSLIAATTFLIGFLITGVISDYKESEKIPTELVSSLEALYDEAYILNKNKGNKATQEMLVWHENFIRSIVRWFYRNMRTKAIIEELHVLDDHFSRIEPLVQPNFLSRMKNEQANVRKMVMRVDNIRDLSFIQSGYAIVETLAFFVIIGMLILKIEPFYEALFFTFLVSFLLTYMILLIKDLDNPFEYSEHGESATEVSIKPLHDLIARITSFNEKTI